MEVQGRPHAGNINQIIRDSRLPRRTARRNRRALKIRAVTPDYLKQDWGADHRLQAGPLNKFVGILKIQGVTPELRKKEFATWL